MGFLSAMFLAGAATFGIPVAIHLIFKTRKQRVMFSSLRFLRESILKETRRLRVRDWLLLLLRCLACILIALAFARPYRMGQVLAGPGAGAAEDLVIVLDTSPSMAAQDGSTGRYQAAVERAVALTEATNINRVGLVFTHAPRRPEVELARNIQAVRAALEAQPKPTDLRGDPVLALKTALDLMVNADAPARRVVLISDFQANQIDREQLAEVGQRAENSVPRIHLDMLSPASDDRPPKKLANVSVTAVLPKSDVWIEGRPVRFAVRLSNHGDGESGGLVVKLLGDADKVLAQKRIAGLGPRDATEVELATSFPRAGEVHFSVQVDARDAFPEDDRRYFAMRLRDSIKALVVEDRLREIGSYLDQGYYLRMALDPRPRGVDIEEWKPDAKNYIRVVSREIAALSAPDLQDADIVYLAGVTAVPAPQVKMLEAFARGGGSVVFFLGHNNGELSEASFLGELYKDGAGLLPARWTGQYQGDKLAGKYQGVDAFKAEHTVFEPFAGENNPNVKDLRRPIFLRYYELEANDLKAGPRPPGEVLATFNDGRPFLVERDFGRGRVLQFPFLPRPEKFTDLPRRKVFLPLIHQTVRYLAGVAGGGQRERTAGEPLVPGQVGIGPDVEVKIERPAPYRDTLDFRGNEEVSADGAGIYKASFRSGELTEHVHWAVNLDPAESVLDPEDLAALKALYASNNGEDVSAEQVQQRLQAQAAEAQKRQAPDWRYLLVAALGCLLLEVWLRDLWRN